MARWTLRRSAGTAEARSRVAPLAGTVIAIQLGTGRRGPGRRRGSRLRLRTVLWPCLRPGRRLPLRPGRRRGLGLRPGLGLRLWLGRLRGLRLRRGLPAGAVALLPLPVAAAPVHVAIAIAIDVGGGAIPLLPYFFVPRASGALLVSILTTLAALFVFGFVKARLTGARPFRGALQTLAIGGLAAAVAFVIARAVA